MDPSCTLHWAPYPNVSTCGIDMAPPAIVAEIAALLGARRAEFERRGRAEDFATVVASSAALWRISKVLRAAGEAIRGPPAAAAAYAAADAAAYAAAVVYAQQEASGRVEAARAALEAIKDGGARPPGGHSALLAPLLDGMRLLPHLPDGGDLATVVETAAAAPPELWHQLRAQGEADVALREELRQRYRELVRPPPAPRRPALVYFSCSSCGR